MDFISTIFRDKRGRLVIWQNPNPPLWVWIVATVLGWFVHGPLRVATAIIGGVGLAAWAFWEARSGVNLFRRMLGVIVLAFLLMSAAGHLIRLLAG